MLGSEQVPVLVMGLGVMKVPLSARPICTRLLKRRSCCGGREHKHTASASFDLCTVRLLCVG